MVNFIIPAVNHLDDVGQLGCRQRYHFQGVPLSRQVLEGCWEHAFQALVTREPSSPPALELMRRVANNPAEHRLWR